MKGRAVRAVPPAQRYNGCPEGTEQQAGLCYPKCREGYYGVGPVCWQRCPDGYKGERASGILYPARPALALARAPHAHRRKACAPLTCADDGALCRRDAHIYGKKCCCTLFGCCHNCKSGYTDDGCTCRRNAHIFGEPAAPPLCWLSQWSSCLLFCSGAPPLILCRRAPPDPRPQPSRRTAAAWASRRSRPPSAAARAAAPACRSGRATTRTATRSPRPSPAPPRRRRRRRRRPPRAPTARRRRPTRSRPARSRPARLPRRRRRGSGAGRRGAGVHAPLTAHRCCIRSSVLIRLYLLRPCDSSRVVHLLQLLSQSAVRGPDFQGPRALKRKKSIPGVLAAQQKVTCPKASLASQ